MLSDSPPERDLQWTNTGIAASFKFINKLYELIDKFKKYKEEVKNNIVDLEDLKSIANQVAENIESFQFNKSVAKIYEFVNTLTDRITDKKISKENFEWGLKKLSIILQPFVPHISEEIWSSIGNSTLCVNESWEEEEVMKKNILKIAIQINGKTKEVIDVDEKSSREIVLETVKNNDKIKRSLKDKKVLREIYVPGKIVNFVTL